MFRVSFAIVALLAFFASSSTASAGSIVFPGSGPLFDTGEPTLKVTLLSGADSGGSSSPFTPLPDIAAASPLIAGEVIFTMIVAGGGPLSNVGFQYGADGIEPKLPAGMRAPAAIPEPATMLLLASGLGLALRRRFGKKDRTQQMMRA
jgi:hypothetical protein